MMLLAGSAYNLKLAQKRADVVVDYLVSKGIFRNRILTISYGQTKPVEPNKLADGSDNPTG